MATALIKIDQPTHTTSPSGIPGRARNDLELAKPVVFKNSDDTGVSRWRWQLRDKPLGSTAVLSDVTQPQVSFTPDVEGSYRITLTVNDGLSGEINTRIGAVETLSEIRYPATGEKAEEVNWDVGGSPNDKGWGKDVEFFLRSQFAGAGAGSAFGPSSVFIPSGSASETFFIGGSGYPTAVGQIKAVDWIDAGGGNSGSPPTVNGYAFITSLGDLGIVAVNIIQVDVDTTGTTDGDQWAFALITDKGAILIPISVGIGADPNVSGPSVIYELDWSAESDQLALTDGVIVVDGNNWTVANSANSTLFQILNGSGLQITATSGVNRDWDGQSPPSSDAPGVYSLLAGITQDVERFDLPLEIWSYLPSTNVPNSNNNIIAGCWGPPTPYSGLTNAAGFGNFATSGPSIKRGSSLNIAAQPGGGHDVVVWRASHDGVIECYSGAWTGTWPDRDQLQLYGRDTSGYGSTLSTTAILRRAGANLLYAAETGSSSGAPSFTLERTRLLLG